MINTNNEAREMFKEAGLTYGDLTVGRLQELRDLINGEMIKSGCIGNTFRCNAKFKTSLKGDRPSAFLRCKSYYFKDREAVSFNAGGFIGFAGWSDSTNIRPILDGFEKWLQWMEAQKERVKS